MFDFSRATQFLRENWKTWLSVAYRLSFSIVVFALTILMLEALYRDAWNLQIVYHVSDLQSFFTSDAGKPIVAPILVILGGFIGWITTLESRTGAVFWVSFGFYAAAILVLLWILVQVSPPINRSMSAILEAYDMSSDDNPLKGMLSIAVASLSGWLANRFVKRTNPPQEGE